MGSRNMLKKEKENFGGVRIRKSKSGTHRNGHRHGRMYRGCCCCGWLQLIGKLEKHTTQQEMESD